jgi:hypothetical protein
MSTPNDYDFGFSFEDEEAIIKASPPPAAANNDQLMALQSKIDSLLDSQEKTVQSALIKAMEEKHKAKIKELEMLILPLLYNLIKNPEKPIINWPNREEVIKKQIEKITAITRG